MIPALLASLLLVGAPQQTAPQTGPTTPPVDLGDIVVEGGSIRDLARDYVGEVAQPVPGRGLARWSDTICIGAANLQPDAAQAIVDGVSDVARDLGLSAGEPGCRPTVLIMATTNASTETEALVNSRKRQFVVGGAGMNQSMATLREFQQIDRPIRWWTVSTPVDSDTGDVAVRVPGRMTGNGSPAIAGGGGVLDYAPILVRRAASRLTTQIIDETSRIYVILDVDQLNGASLDQLIAYISMVSLAQVDPDADTSRYATILNLFDDPEHSPGLTDWDRAYLHGLYNSQRNRRNSGAHRLEVASSIARAHRDIVAARDAAPTAAD